MQVLSDEFLATFCAIEKYIDDKVMHANSELPMFEQSAMRLGLDLNNEIEEWDLEDKFNEKSDQGSEVLNKQKEEVYKNIEHFKAYVQGKPDPLVENQKVKVAANMNQEINETHFGDLFSMD
jgi:hypothetical protein